MPRLRTNRDLYLFITALVERQSKDRRDLESYLTALWWLGSEKRGEEALSLDAFAGLLAEAFERRDFPIPALARPGQQEFQAAKGFALWQVILRSQIVDLRDMRKAGLLDRPDCYFGVDAPSGARWYNVTTTGYLECAVAGTFGGWREGDDTGRAYVPGKVAVLDEEGNIEAVDPRSIEDTEAEIPELGWDDFAEFLCTGRDYE